MCGVLERIAVQENVPFVLNPVRDMSSLGRPLSAVLVAIVLWVTVALVAPFGYWRYGFVAVIAVLAALSYWLPGRLALHVLGGVLPVVVLISVWNLIDSHQFFGRVHLHGPSFVMILGGVAVVLGLPAAIGLAIGDSLGRRRLTHQARA